MTDYKAELHLRFNEAPAKVDKETGEITEYEINSPEKRNPNTVRFTPDYVFKVYNEEAWKLLKTQLTKEELLVAYEMAAKAKPFNGSLEPLNDQTTITELSKTFNVDRRKIKKITNKLFNLGVFAKFDISEQDIDFVPKHKRYWVFNPYLAFNGKFIDKSYRELFKNTVYAKITK